LGTVAKTIDTYGTGGVGQAALRDIENFKQGGSLPTNVMKTAAVNLAVGAAGAKAAQVAGRAAVATGIPARAANKLTGRAVMVHGTGERLVGKQLRPRAGSPGSPSDAMVFGWNPMSKNSSQWLPENAANYSNRVGGEGPPDYNVVIGKVKKSKTDLGKPGSNPNIIRSSAPVDIKQVVKSPGATGVSYETYAKELERALKKAGAPTRGKLSNKINDAKRRAAYKRSDKGGVS
jgi:hypothetical protein